MANPNPNRNPNPNPYPNPNPNPNPDPNQVARVKRHNAPVWRKYMRYVVVSEEVRCCGADACCAGGLLGSRYRSFEFPASRIVGICLVHKVRVRVRVRVL